MLLKVIVGYSVRRVGENSVRRREKDTCHFVLKNMREISTKVKIGSQLGERENIDWFFIWRIFLEEEHLKECCFCFH